MLANADVCVGCEGEMESGITVTLILFLREKFLLDECVYARFRVHHVDTQVVLAC